MKKSIALITFLAALSGSTHQSHATEKKFVLCKLSYRKSDGAWASPIQVVQWDIIKRIQHSQSTQQFRDAFLSGKNYLPREFIVSICTQFENGEMKYESIYSEESDGDSIIVTKQSNLDEASKDILPSLSALELILGTVLLVAVQNKDLNDRQKQTIDELKQFKQNEWRTEKCIWMLDNDIAKAYARDDLIGKDLNPAEIEKALREAFGDEMIGRDQSGRWNRIFTNLLWVMLGVSLASVSYLIYTIWGQERIENTDSQARESQQEKAQEEEEKQKKGKNKERSQQGVEVREK